VFVDELCWKEQDSAKHDKIHKLKLRSEEWMWVNTFVVKSQAFLVDSTVKFTSHQVCY